MDLTLDSKYQGYLVHWDHQVFGHPFNPDSSAVQPCALAL